MLPGHSSCPGPSKILVDLKKQRRVQYGVTVYMSTSNWNTQITLLTLSGTSCDIFKNFLQEHV